MQNELQPEDLLEFIELPAFTRRWKVLGLDDEGDLTALQFRIMAAPKRPPLICGTKGLRKLRFAPPRSERGKSGTNRVLYVYFEEFGYVLLCLVYSKNETANISAAVKAQVNKLIEAIERELQRVYVGRRKRAEEGR